MTLYGPGGADAREPRGRGLHPAVLALVAAAGTITVAALGYWVLRDPAEAPQPSAPAAAPGAASSAAATTTVAAGRRLTTGSWVLALAADRKTRLSADDDFAAMTRTDPMVLTVVPGLADEDCFTFRGDDGKYLRHYDYRLRFDDLSDEDLFRADATFCLEDGLPAGTVRLRSKNYPGHALHRRDEKLYIDEPDGTKDFSADSTFTIQEPPNS
ncbi:AbfB domain-containing protein [Actinoplanes sp. NPDC051861]|uniref:AbfB domain-containing protein n=1 Tax=Actinoplanes sp. NPDC051861 TaxID=3155170 RepID=UPI00344774D2